MNKTKRILCNSIIFCFHRPTEISNDVYNDLKILKTKEEQSLIDASVGNIINVIVSYDMGWSKRGNGRSYDSLNGYGTIIGFLSGKILDYRSRNRKCRICDQGDVALKARHDCRKNFQGSAKSMEADAGAELVNCSTVLKEVGLNVGVVIGDDDSSAIAAIREGSSTKIFKLSDTNHLKKHFTSDLYVLKSHFKELRKKGVIEHLKRCFSYAVIQNKGTSFF